MVTKVYHHSQQQVHFSPWRRSLPSTLQPFMLSAHTCFLPQVPKLIVEAPTAPATTLPPVHPPARDLYPSMKETYSSRQSTPMSPATAALGNTKPMTPSDWLACRFPREPEQDEWANVNINSAERLGVYPHRSENGRCGVNVADWDNDKIDLLILDGYKQNKLTSNWLYFLIHVKPDANSEYHWQEMTLKGPDTETNGFL